MQAERGKEISEGFFAAFNFLKNKIEGTPILKLAMVKR